MVRRLAALLLLVASTAFAQEPYALSKSDHAIPKSGGTSSVSSSIQFVQEEGATVSGATRINFLGSTVTCVYNAGTTAADCTFTGGGAPTTVDYLVGTADPTLLGEIVVGVTPGGELGGTWAAPTIDDTLGVTNWTLTTPTISGAVAFPDGTRQTFNPDATTPGLSVGSQAGDPSAPSNGDVWYDSTANELTARINSANISLGGPAPNSLIQIFDDFLGGNSASAAASMSPGEVFRCNGNGTSAGCVSASTSPLDANTAGIWTVNTGTTATGMAAIHTPISTTDATGSLSITGGEILEARIYVPVVSGAVNTFNTTVGYCDIVTTATACPNQILVSWDNNTNANWVITNIDQVGGTTTATSNTVATVAAWHKIRIVVNSNATSVAFFVDGTELNVSPLTTNIPINRSVAIMPLRIVSSLSANAKTAGIDYAWFKKAVSR